MTMYLNRCTFPFKQLSLATPTGVQGGTYYSKILLNNETVYFQAPKCLTKNGIKKTDKKHIAIFF